MNLITRSTHLPQMTAHLYKLPKLMTPFTLSFESISGFSKLITYLHSFLPPSAAVPTWSSRDKFSPGHTARAPKLRRHFGKCSRQNPYINRLPNLPLQQFF